MRYSSKTISTNNCFTNNKNIEQTYFATLGGPYYITLWGESVAKRLRLNRTNQKSG